MEKAKQIQAHKINKCKKTKNKDQLTDEQELSETPDSGSDINLNNDHLVENRRRQYQGYLDQKEVRVREEEKGDNTKEHKRDTRTNSHT
eukprot:8581889-Heterocapsa_arctica.AAC.1